MITNNKWFVRPHNKHKVNLRIFCFPYAGGNAMTYTPWVSHLDSSVELIAIQPPGRTTRILESAITTMDHLTDQLLVNIQNMLNEPYILFGHSLGSRVAFDLMHKIQRLGLSLPKHFIASGSRGPGTIATKKSISQLPDEEFINELKLLNGTPPEILANRELMELYLPMLKADFGIAENYHCTNNVKFDCPISVLAGDEDGIKMHDLTSWGDYFETPAKVYMLPGDHFFIDKNRHAVLACVNTIIDSVLVSNSNKIKPVKKLKLADANQN